MWTNVSAFILIAVLCAFVECKEIRSSLKTSAESKSAQTSNNSSSSSQKINEAQMPKRIDVLKEIDNHLPGHEYTWVEFVEHFSNMAHNDPEFHALREIFVRFDRGISKDDYLRILSQAVDGTLLDSLDKHDEEPHPVLQTPEFQDHMRRLVIGYLDTIKSQDSYNLKDYFEDIYEHKLFSWTGEINHHDL